MRRHVGIVLVLACASFTVAAADPVDTPETRREAAERYIEVSDLQHVIDDMVENLSKSMPEAERQIYRELMTRHLRIDVLQTTMLAAMQKNFTTRELNALADFYGSAEGRSAMAKFGVYMADVMPVIQAEIKRAVAEYEQERARMPKPTGT